MKRVMWCVIAVGMWTAGCEVGSVQDAVAEQSELTTGAINPLSGAPDPTVGTLWSPNNGTVLFHGRWIVPLVFAVGQPVPIVTVSVRDNTSTCPTCVDGDTVSALLVSSVTGSLAGATSIGPNGSTPSDGVAGTGPLQTLTLNAGGHIVAADEVITLQVKTLGLWSNPSTARDAIAVIEVGTPVSDYMLSINSTSLASSTWSFQVSPNSMRSNSPGMLIGGLPSFSGDTVKAVSFQIAGTGGQVTAAVKVSDATARETVIGSAVVTPSSAWSVATVDVADTAIQANGGLLVVFTASAAGMAIGSVSARYAHPL